MEADPLPPPAALGARVVVRGGDLPWQASPSPLVARKRLYHSGPPEAGVVTSIVRYAPGAQFPEHPHPQGEEILVLDGTFSDQRGDFPAGTYMLNPEGFRHAPFSREGCVLFVKLRQYAGDQRESVLLETQRGSWEARQEGVRSLELYRSARHVDRVRLTQLSPGVELPPIALPGGEELFVVSGELADEQGTYPAHTWLLLPPGSSHRPRSAAGCLLYVRSPLVEPAAEG